MDKIVLDKRTFKALAIDTRVDILKSLKQRRKTASELSKELSLSVPTIAEHLDKMQSASLVKKEHQGKKWVYYNLTSQGSGILSPKLSSVFVLMLSVSIILMLVGSLNIFTLQSHTTSFERTINVPDEQVETYSTAGAKATETQSSLGASNTLQIEEKNQTQTIKGEKTEYFRTFSYESLIIALAGILTFLFAVLKLRKPAKFPR